MYDFSWPTIKTEQKHRKSYQNYKTTEITMDLLGTLI